LAFIVLTLLLEQQEGYLVFKNSFQQCHSFSYEAVWGPRPNSLLQWKGGWLYEGWVNIPVSSV